MNILWIEDFGGNLPTGTDTLNLLFKDLIKFDDWDEDLYSLLKKPKDLEDYCQVTKSQHCIFLCLNFFDYQEFKNNFNLIQKIDAIIIDIRLDNGVDFNKPIPEWTGDKSKFHSEAGFYIFNDLVHFGFPSEKICFMTGESGKLEAFDARRSEIYFPKAASFTKNKEEELLRQWLKSQATDCMSFRRGVIEGCEYLSQLVDQSEDNVQFREFIKIENNKATIEIPTIEIKNYLDVLKVSLNIRKPSDENSLNNHYRLFLRTLSHEWEENVDTYSLKHRHINGLSKILDIYTYAWIMKMTRNWVAHAKLLEPLNEKFIAFLFLINMRAMFRLPKSVLPYEWILLDLFSSSSITKNIRNDIDYAERLVDENWNALKISTTKKSDKIGEEQKKHFGEKINYIYRRSTGNPDAEAYPFKRFLFQYFWINQKQQLRNLVANSDEFLPTLARHIYHQSFPET